jgi:CRP/FNR family transcriptional regulator
VPPRQVIFREGDPCRDLHVLVEGRVECYRSSVEGREQIMIVFDRPGDTFCISSAFATGRNLVTARALTLTRLGVIDRGTFVDVAGRNPAMALQLVKTVSRDAARIMDLAESLALRTARARVARLLYEQAVAEGVRSGQGVELARERLREEEVAARVGTVRVHVSRSLRSLVRSGTIVLDRALIRIPDLAGLARAAQGHADRIGRERPLARAFSRPARPVTFVTDTGPTRA